MKQSQLVLYSRDGCHLCEDLLDDLNRLQQQHKFSFETRDVDENPNWYQSYNELVPILFYGEQEICRYFLDPASLLAVLDQS